MLASVALLVCASSITMHTTTTATAATPQPVGGETAIALLGADAPRVADKYDMTAEELKSELLDNDTLKVDAAKRLLYIDPLHSHDSDSHDHIKAEAAPTALSSYPYGGGDYTSTDAFLLHSKPSAPVVIYLDFTGHTTTGTAWNNSYGSTIVSGPLNYDSNATTFNAAERTVIAKVWAGVAEDYAPFNVDVTTQEPNVEMLKKSSSTDVNYGIRVVITPNAFVSAGGVAYLGSFSWSSDTPTFAFAANYAPDDIVEVISHEVGHTFGLRHDGTTAGVEYFSGQGDWAPIMGVGYYKSVTQWSKGEYTNANNKEDDTAVIAGIAPLVTDDYADSQSSALMMTDLSMRGLISTPADKDWFSFSFGGGSLRVKATPAFYGNLDSAIEVYRGTTLVSRIDPAGLSIDSTLTALPAGSYQLMLEGTGAGSATATGYSDYGSLGEYLLTLEGAVSIDPPATINVTTSSTFATSGSTVTFTASSPSHPAFNGVTLAWVFSDGTTANTATVTKTMPSAALSATLTATTTNGGVTVKTSYIRSASRPSVTATAAPTSVKTGALVTFTAVGSDPDNQTLTYAWSFSDGTAAIGATATKTAANIGTLSGTVTVTDTDNLTGTATTSTSVVTNLPPTLTLAVATLPAVAPANLTLKATAVDPERTSLTYLWVFQDGTRATTANTLKTFSQAGTYTVTATVTDAGGASTTKTLTFTVGPNNAPVVSTATVTPTTQAAPASFTFKASATDVDKQALTYAWVFADGSKATGVTAALKNLTAPGVYTATVTATDTGGLTATKTVSYTVTANNAPTVSVATATPTAMAAPASFTFTATGADVDKQTLTYAWTFSDGSTATTQTVKKTATTPGTYTATVTVRDTGGLTATKTVSYTVTANNAPTVSVATATPTAMAAPASFTFTATGADVDKQALTYAWVFADGSKATTQTVKKTATAPGTYTATVTATDTGGLTATKTVSYTVTANNAPTVVSASVTAASLPAGQSRTFSASASDADNQTLTYKWVFGDGSTSTKASAAKTFSTRGSFTATLTVTDTGGLTATRPVSYTVT